VVAYLALFVALSGTAVAAKPLIDGTDVQDESLTGADMLNNSVGGDDVDESSLGQVASADADTLDGKDSTDFLGATAKAADADLLDGKNSTDFVGANAKASDSDSDSDKLDGFDSEQLKSNTCPSGYVFDGALCWENVDQNGFTLAAAANRCRQQGGRLPLLSEFEALAKSGIALGTTTMLDWTGSSAGDDNSIYINSADPENMDGVRANSTSSWARCVRQPVNALGSP
jgi:hypothetical protein